MPLAIVAPTSPTETAPLRALGTAPLVEPVREPVRLPMRVPASPTIVSPARKRAPLTYDVYTPDDTLRGKPAIVVDLTDDARRRRLCMWVLGITLALGTTLAGIGSCEDRATSAVETTAASAPPPPAPPAPVATSAASPPVIEPPVFTPVPPLGPTAKPPRRRSPPSRPPARR